MPTIRLLAATLMLLVVPALSACAKDAVPCTPTIRDGWLRLPPMEMPMLAGFARIENTCATQATVVGASSAAFREVSLHETRVVNGVSRMRMLAELPIAARGAAELAPGGLHLMLEHPVRKLAPGDTVRVEFQLKDGRRVASDFVVRAPGTR